MLKKVIAALVLLCSCVMLVPSFECKASDLLYYEMPFAEPTTSINSGYITVLYAEHGETNPMNWFPYVFQWNIMPENDSSTVSSSCMNLTIQKDGRIYFSSGQGETQLSTITIFCLTDGGEYYTVSTDISADDTWSRAVNYSAGYDILGYKVFGNYGTVSDDFSWGENRSYNISWSTDDLLHQYLINMFNQQIQSNKNDSTMIAKLTEIFNSVDSVENKLDELKEIQNQSNTWLEKIFNYLNESQEKQKQEAQTQGNSSVNQGNSAIEDKGGDFAGSLGGLTNSMSYTGTKCAWEFPQVKLPAISGVMGEIVLIENQPIDFAVWVNAIPSDILLVVQSLCTAALIIYCFKELYDTIAYVLTLRKDDNS